MKKVLFLSLFMILACKEKEFKRVDSIEQIQGNWVFKQDTLKIDAPKMTLQINNGPVQRIITEEDGFSFLVNAFTGAEKTFSGLVLIRKNTLSIIRTDGAPNGWYQKIK
jgi:hypothetical protein